MLEPRGVVVNFSRKFPEPILAGNKWMTIRAELGVNAPGLEGLEMWMVSGGELFATTVIEEHTDCQVEHLPEMDFDGHMNYDTAPEAQVDIQGYYDDVTVRLDDVVDIIEWDPDNVTKRATMQQDKLLSNRVKQ